MTNGISSGVVERAQLDIVPGREAAFEEAFGEAVAVIRRQPGCRGVTLSRGVEEPSSYLLLVEWDRLEDHTEGFVGSPDFQVWRGLLHEYYAGPASVRHYAPLVVPAPSQG